MSYIQLLKIFKQERNDVVSLNFNVEGRSDREAREEAALLVQGFGPLNNNGSHSVITLYGPHSNYLIQVN